MKHGTGTNTGRIRNLGKFAHPAKRAKPVRVRVSKHKGGKK